MRKIKTVTIIGCGNVGSLLGALLQTSGLYQIQQLYSRRRAKAQAARELIGAGDVITRISDIALADSYCLSVSDDAIATVCAQLVLALKPKLANCASSSMPLLFHCSGALASQTALESAVKKAFLIGSLHPAFSISDVEQAIRSFPGAVCSIESPCVDVCEVLKVMVGAIGGRAIILKSNIKPEQKLLYHAALVIAGNYTSVLIQSALTLLHSLNIDEKEGLALLKPLLMPMIERLFDQGPVKASTGPIVRGECELLKQQIKVLTEFDPSLGELYQQLGKRLVSIVERQGELTPKVLSQLRQLFEGAVVRRD